MCLIFILKESKIYPRLTILWLAYETVNEKKFLNFKRI